MLKSVLKKPCVSHVCNGRRVTFCETVKIYSTETLSEPLADSPNGDLELTLEDLAEEWDPFASKCLILSWQDDDDDGDIVESLDSRQSEKPEDFLVHKVFYNPVDLKDADSSNEHEDSALSNEQEPDCQPFVVHQVEGLGRNSDDDETSSDSDDAETPSDDTLSSKQETDDVRENFCELSIKNIEQHNKLLKTDIVTCCEESRQPHSNIVNDTVTISKEIGLSPPLKELGIDKLISQSGNKWLLNLDISPLSSVQETDSESNLSSEDTMIMMTSEECEKNEKRIKESFQKFEWLKKQKCKENEGFSQISCTESDQNNTAMQEVFTVAGREQIAAESLGQAEFDVTELTREISAPEITSVDYDVQKTTRESAEVTDATIVVLVEDVIENKSAVSPSRRDSTISLDTSLSDVEIPQDVREWKIEIGKVSSDNPAELICDTHGNTFPAYSVSAESSKSVGQCLEETDITESDPTAPFVHGSHLEKASISDDDGNKPDELELFVNQCTERVERIRKRYSLNETAVWSPRRGIRPRYGSTAEIVQRLQDGQQSVHVHSHYSWPNYMSLGHESAHLDSSFCSSSLPADFYSFPPEVMCNNRPQRPDITREFDDRSNEDVVYSEAPNYTSQSQHIPTSFLFTFDERGVPEGASPPRLSSESLYEAETQSDSIVYYSMKV